MVKPAGNDDAISIIIDNIDNIGERETAILFKLQLSIVYGVKNGDITELTTKSIRSVLAVKANSMKKKRQQETLDVVERNGYKGTRDSFNRPNPKHSQLWF